MIAALAASLGLSHAAARLMLVAGLMLALWGAVAWLRNDAAADERARLAAEAAKARIETIEDTKRRRNDVEKLPDDTLLDNLLGRVSGASTPATD